MITIMNKIIIVQVEITEYHEIYDQQLYVPSRRPKPILMTMKALLNTIWKGNTSKKMEELTGRLSSTCSSSAICSCFVYGGHIVIISDWKRKMRSEKGIFPFTLSYCLRPSQSIFIKRLQTGTHIILPVSKSQFEHKCSLKKVFVISLK